MYKILDTLDELYTNNLVYRTIIVCNNTDDYKYILNKNNYDVNVLDNYNENLNYDSLDIRIFLISKEKFIKFIEDYNKTSVDVCFYTSVVFEPEKDGTSELKNTYNKICKNTTLIVDML